MKINVYQEQYKSSQAHHDPGKIGFGTDVNRFVQTGTTLINAAMDKMQKDDEFNSARIEADTNLAADKLYREFQETANPDDFEGDVERQRGLIQNLIQEQSKQFKLPASRNAFVQKMTRGLETQYMGDTLKYSYELQETRYKQLGQEAFDSYKAQLLAGNRFITVEDTMAAMRDYYTTLAKRYHIPQDKLDEYLKNQNTSIVKSYAYGMIEQNPQIVRDLLVGNSFDKFRAYKESRGEAFEMDQFWQDANLRKEYQESEFGAQWTNVSQYLDYETRIDLWQMANGEIERKNKEQEKQKFLQNSMSDYDLDLQRDAAISQAKSNGKLTTKIVGATKITYADDPGIGTKNQAVAMGQISYGKIDSGNKVSTQAKQFAGGVSGAISAQGYKVRLTSSIRPNDTGSKHVDGSAVDLQILGKDGKVSEQGFISAYKSALALYGNNIRKNSVLFEMDPTRLDQIKQQLENEGVDTSFVNWEQSKKYGKIAHEKGGAHLHLGIDKNADYSVTNSGQGVELTFKTQHGKQRYLQKRAEGKSVQEAYDAAREDEHKIFVALEEYNLTQRIVLAKDSAGNLVSPSQYGKILDQVKREVDNDTKLSDADRLIKHAAIEAAKTKIPKLQEMYRDDTVTFLIETGQAKNSEEAAVLQDKLYHIAPSEIKTMSDAEAQTKAAEFTKMNADNAVDYIKSEAVNPASLRQLSKYISTDDQRAQMLLYAAMATPTLTAQIKNAGNEWKQVEEYISKHDKIFGANWRAKIEGKFRANSTVKNYFSDISKTNPVEAEKMLNAMSSIYAYRMYSGATNSDNVIDDIAKNLIGANYNTVTVDNPRFGNTQISVATSFQGNDLYKIKRVCNIISSLGIDANSIGLVRDIEQGGNSAVSKASAEESNITRRHELDNILKTAKLSGTPDGLSAMFTWEDAKGIYAGSIIRDKTAGNAPMQISYKDMVEAYNEAYAIMQGWKLEGQYYKGGKTYKGNTYKLEHSRYARFKGTYEYDYGTAKNPYEATEEHAMSAALEYVLTNKYNFLNKTEYSNLTNTSKSKQLYWTSPNSLSGKNLKWEQGR